MGLQTKSVQLHFEYFDEWTWVSNSTMNSFLNISATTLIGKEEWTIMVIFQKRRFPVVEVQLLEVHFQVSLQIPFWETQQEKVYWILQPSFLVDRASVATVVVFYNEESYALEKTLKSLSLQLSNYMLDHDLLLIGDGLEQMSTSMGAYLQKLFYPQTIPMDEDCWPLNGNTCVVNNNSDHNFWPHGK